MIYSYFSSVQYKIDIIRSYYFSSEFSSHYGDEIDLKFASEFPIIPISQVLIIIIGSIIYDKKIVKHKIVVPSDSFLIKILKKILIMEEAKLWDFKKTLGMGHAETRDKKEELQVKFCEDIAALANSKGGLLIIGISDKIPRTFYDINNLEINKQSIASAIRKWTNIKREYYIMKEINLEYQNKERKCIYWSY